MEDFTPPDRKAAAQAIDRAATALFEAVRTINLSQAEPLRDLAMSLAAMATKIRVDGILPGLTTPITSASAGGRALGKVPSDKKLAALAKAREKLAKMRQTDREQRNIRKFIKERGIRPM